jgi:hypothetical protein
VLPLLAESEPLVPRNSPSSVLDIQDRDDLFVHARPEVIYVVTVGTIGVPGRSKISTIRLVLHTS